MKWFLKAQSLLIPWFVFLNFFFLSSCSPFKDISTENGRKALVEKTENFLNDSDCDGALNTIFPLYDSSYVNNEIRKVTASAYACQGGIKILNFVDALESANSDVWSGIVAANHSKNLQDGKLINLLKAANVLRETSIVEGSYSAEDRPSDVNFFMIFIQASILGTTISRDDMGQANITTGKKTQSINGLGSNTDRCRIVVAISTISDCLSNISNTTAFGALESNLSDLCGGPCPLDLDPNTCPILKQTAGAALISAIDSQWSL